MSPVIIALRRQWKEAVTAIDEYQAQCPHPKVTRVPRSDTGNYCKQDDRYWNDCYCEWCDKRWEEPQ